MFRNLFASPEKRFVGDYSSWMRPRDGAGCMGTSGRRQYLTVEEEYKLIHAIIASVKERPQDWVRGEHGRWGDIKTGIVIDLNPGTPSHTEIESHTIWFDQSTRKAMPESPFEADIGLRKGSQKALVKAFHGMVHQVGTTNADEALKRLEAVAVKPKQIEHQPEEMERLLKLPEGVHVKLAEAAE